MAWRFLKLRILIYLAFIFLVTIKKCSFQNCVHPGSNLRRMNCNEVCLPIEQNRLNSILNRCISFTRAKLALRAEGEATSVSHTYFTWAKRPPRAEGEATAGPQTYVSLVWGFRLVLPTRQRSGWFVITTPFYHLNAEEYNSCFNGNIHKKSIMTQWIFRLLCAVDWHFD